MKRLYVFMISLTTMFCLMGCGNESTNNTQFSETQTTKTTQITSKTTTKKTTVKQEEIKLLTKGFEYNGISFKLPDDCSTIKPYSDIGKEIGLNSNEIIYDGEKATLKIIYNNYDSLLDNNSAIEKEFSSVEYKIQTVDGIKIIKIYQMSTGKYIGNLYFNYGKYNYIFIFRIEDSSKTTEECRKLFDEFVDTLNFR